jgi:hypothetical protein
LELDIAIVEAASAEPKFYRRRRVPFADNTAKVSPAHPVIARHAAKHHRAQAAACARWCVPHTVSFA